MVRALGIDPGTKSFDLVLIEGPKVIKEVSIETIEVARNPSVLTEAIKELSADIIAGPSGYGTPLVFNNEIINPRGFALEVLLLSTEDDIRRGIELGELGIAVYDALAKVVEDLWRSKLNVCYIPSVKLLPTVPTYRKINKLDMGTADKLAATVLGIYDQSRRLGINYDEVSFIYVELGFGYNAVVGVEGGKVVDGLGGTLVPMGFLTIGPIDTELVVVGREWFRGDVFHGGVSDVCGIKSIEELIKAVSNGECLDGFNAMIESVIKAAYAIRATSVKEPKEVLISGRLVRYDEIRKVIEEGLSSIAPVKRVEGLKGASVSKEAAQGYALIAEGIAGGYFKELVDHVGIKEARGTLGDYLYHPKLRGLRDRLVNAYKRYLREEVLHRVLGT